MLAGPSSQHLKSAVELTLVANIRLGFVPSLETVSYATRLGLLLNLLFELRKSNVERTEEEYIGPLERLRTLHFVRWSIFDSGRKLLLAVTFDRPWEPYIRTIADEAGPLLDAIFCHCEGYRGHACSDGFVPFARWVRAHQVPVSYFHAAEPDLTADDVRYLKEFERRYWRSRSDPHPRHDELTNLVLGPRGSDGIPSGTKRINPKQLQLADHALTALGRYFQASPDREFFSAAKALLLEVDAGTEHPDNEAPAAGRHTSVPSAALSDVQGNILEPYANRTHGCVALLSFASGVAARACLAQLADEITSASTMLPEDAAAINLALTHEGLKTLGLSQAQLAAFPREFCEGMARRAGMLGDIGPDHPSAWKRPRRNGRVETPDCPQTEVELSIVDAVLTLQYGGPPPNGCDASWSKQHPLYGRLERLLEPLSGVELLHVQPLQRRYAAARSEGEPRFVEEHFGYKDGISQPIIRNLHRSSDFYSRNAVELGEVLLGYPNDRGACYEPAGEPSVGASNVSELTKNGSFMVLRKLEQDVAGLRSFVRACAQQSQQGTQNERIERVYALLMGRSRDGTPLAPNCSKGTLNDFDFDDDVPGTPSHSCPVASHIRRSNPRLRPRSVRGRTITTPHLVRRGFSYGPPPSDEDDGAERGLLFMAYNASIAQQFEVIQSWINGGNSSGAPSSQACPIASNRRDLVFQVPDFFGEPAVWKREQPFVRLCWGMYLFTPSVSAIRKLAGLQPAESRSESEDELAKAGRDLIASLRRVELLEADAHQAQGEAPAAPTMRDRQSFVLWKTLLEDVSPQAQQRARAVWCAIRRDGGVLRTPYGVLVANHDLAHAVLGDETRFSVRRYWRRMNESVGPLHLGMDRCPARVTGPHRSHHDDAYERAVEEGDYERSNASSVRDRLRQLESARQHWWAGAYERHVSGVARAQDEQNPCDLACGFGAAQLRSQSSNGRAQVELGTYARAVVSDVSRCWFGLPDTAALSFEDFYAVACYLFYPHPEPHVQQAAQQVSDKIARTRQAAEQDPLPPSPALGQADFDQRLACTQGFLIATFASLLSVLRLGVQQRWLWRLQYQVRSGRDEQEVHSSFRSKVVESLSLAPKPHVLHRKPVRTTTLGSIAVDPSDYVVVGLSAVMADQHPRTPSASLDPLAWAFGGSAALGQRPVPTHACPGREIALAVIEGALLALCLRENLREESALQLSYSASPPQASGSLRPGSAGVVGA